MITLIFSCSGCEKVEQGTSFLKSKFVSITGKSYGFGRWQHETVEDVIPEGWIAFDPYTNCTYCPECWESIIHGNSQDTQLLEVGASNARI